jgi:hypothetical protein
MPTETIHKARKTRPCGEYRCDRSIEQGALYRRHVGFPGDAGVSGTTPWVIDECGCCADQRGYPIPDRTQVCDFCGRTGTRGFRTFPAGTRQTAVGPASWPAFTRCVAEPACRQRAYRSIPVEVRAEQRYALEVNA